MLASLALCAYLGMVASTGTDEAAPSSDAPIQATDSAQSDAQPLQIAPSESPAPNAINEGIKVTTHLEKHTNYLIVGGEFLVSSTMGYLALLGGILLNIPRGGISQPMPDADDVLLLGLFPTGVVVGAAWLIGLVDYAQRDFLLNIVWAVAGATVGEIIGVTLAFLIGRAAFPRDGDMAAICATTGGPILAAAGTTFFMEYLKPGRTVETPVLSIAATRTDSGKLALGPAMQLRF